MLYLYVMILSCSFMETRPIATCSLLSFTYGRFSGQKLTDKADLFPIMVYRLRLSKLMFSDKNQFLLV